MTPEEAANEVIESMEEDYTGTEMVAVVEAVERMRHKWVHHSD